jgi:colanic acid/amylovoran biosynthesis glycosyltransferase
MKIAFILTAFPTLAETFIMNQITGLLDMGHDLEIFAQYNLREKKVHVDINNYHLLERVHYFNIPQKRIKRIVRAIFLVIKNFHSSPGLICKSLNILKYRNLGVLYNVIPFLNKKFDIIHCHFGPNGIIGTHLKDIGIHGKIITSFHGYDVNSYPKIAGDHVYKNLFQKGDMFTTNTHFTKDQVIKLGGNKKRIIVLPVGLKIDKFRFSARKRKPGEPIKILTVGRLVEKKGHKYAMQAIARIIKKYNNIVYIIAGDGPLRNELDCFASECGIRNHVLFLAEVNQDEVLSLYEQAHIFLLPSITATNGDREGQALVLQEAQAVGLPVISTIHNGIPEGVRDGKSGFIVPEGDVDALTDRLLYLIEHPESWGDMGRAGRAFVEKNYSSKKLNKQLMSIYQSLITEGKR